MEGDELDVTLPKSSKETGVMDAAQPSTDSNGLSVLQKLSLFAVIVAVVAIYLRTRNNRVSGEKSIV